MTDLPTRMVEAGARAMWLGQTDHESAGWDRAATLPAEDDWREFWREQFRACLTAALALAEGEGVVLVKVPDEMPAHPSSLSGFLRASGHNACRAKMLAGKVTMELDRSEDDE